MKKNLFVAIWLVSCVLLGCTVARCETPKKENLSAKYMAGLFGLVVGFEEGCEQGYFFLDESSKWAGLTKDNSHLHYGLRRTSMVGAGLLVSQWHPKQRFLSGRTAVQWFSYWTLYSFVHNRGLRLVQTGRAFPINEFGHSFYFDIGFIRVEVKMRNEIQWGMLGMGVIGLAIDAAWNHIF